jgi:hypothetical protein
MGSKSKRNIMKSNQVQKTATEQKKNSKKENA